MSSAPIAFFTPFAVFAFFKARSWRFASLLRRTSISLFFFLATAISPLLSAASRSSFKEISFFSSSSLAAPGLLFFRAAPLQAAVNFELVSRYVSSAMWGLLEHLAWHEGKYDDDYFAGQMNALIFESTVAPLMEKAAMCRPSQ